MQKSITICLFLSVTMVISAQVQKKETAHFSAKYSKEAEAYAMASLQVLEAAWIIAVQNGYDLPEKIKFSIKKSDRNALYFNRKSLKEISWEYKKLGEFLPPEKSRKNNIYGLCHELGHLCMYNTTHNRNSWMSYDYRESWADYFGNMIVDSLYEKLGMDCWPEPHNYRKFAGMDYFLSRIEKNNPDLQSFNHAGLFWYELGVRIGFNKVPEFFSSLQVQQVNNPGAQEKFFHVLTVYLEEENPEEWFEQYAEDLIISQD